MMISSVPLLHHCCQCFSESRSFHHPLSRFRPTARPSYLAFLHFKYSASSIGLKFIRYVSSTHNINSTPFFSDKIRPITWIHGWITSTGFPVAHLYWIPSSPAGCISNIESAKISTLYWIASSSPLLDSQ